MTIKPFVSNPKPLHEIEDSMAYVLHQALEECEGDYQRITAKEQEHLYQIFSELWHPDTYRLGIYRVLGWKIDFSEWLRPYLISYNTGDLMEVMAFSEEHVFKCAFDPDSIEGVFLLNKNLLSKITR